jgi:predicted acyl esterase
MRSGRALITAVACAIAVMLAPAGAAAAPPAPFGHACEPRPSGVLFCPTLTLADRVPSFDGTPIDVDVTLPGDAEAGEPLPTIVMLHGYGGNKRAFESESPEGSSSTTYHYNNTYYAQRGFAVVNPTARGFGGSCGAGSEFSPGCLPPRKSYVHLADQRWEARDVQHLLGLLVDQQVSDRRALGTTGISYGGGQSIELAYLRDRIRLEDGSFAPWRSPAGRRLAIAAAYPRWPWSDLVDSLLPNGRYLDFRAPSRTETRDPLGVMKQSYVNLLFVGGSATGTYCGEPPHTPCTDPTADLPAWFARIQAGEPYGSDARAIADEIYSFHQGFGIRGRTPAPMLLQSGWTDDLFPPKESIRVYNDSRRRGGFAAMQLGDLGHQRGSNKANADRYFNDQGSDFFDRWLTDGSGGPGSGQVDAFTQTCPREVAPADGPFTASSYRRLARGEVRFGAPGTQMVLAGGGNTVTGGAFDPITGGGNACRETAQETAPGTAVVEGPVSEGYTLLGLPTVRARIATTGSFGQLDSRLWDVSPDGMQRLISRGAYRLRDFQNGRVTFQLHGNGWCFEPGHRPKLELLGKDEPFLRPSNPPPGAFSVSVSDVRVELPIAERRPGECSRESEGGGDGDGGDGDDGDDGDEDGDDGDEDDSDRDDRRHSARGNG